MTGSVMERSHAPLTMWAAAFHLATSSKKSFSAHQLHRGLGCQHNTARFLHHRVMEAMRRGGLDIPPMGGKGKVVEFEETYFGNLPEHKVGKFNCAGKPRAPGRKFGPHHKRTILSQVERGSEVRSFHVEQAYAECVAQIVRNNIDNESRLHTDESCLYWKVGEEFVAHERVVHSKKECARSDVLWCHRGRIA